MTRRLAALVPVVVGVWALAPAVAVAQTPSPFNPSLPAISTPTTTTAAATTPATTTTSGEGVSGTDAIAIAVGAIALLAGIALFIWRDARRRAPKRGHNVTTAGTTARAGTKPPPKPRKPSPAERRRRKRGRAR
jgi:hypothetical protein